MIRAGLLLAVALPALAVDGTVINQTTGKPQPGAVVSLFKFTQSGPESAETVKSDASGKFVFTQQLSGAGMIQTAFDGVTYNHMLQARTPTTGVTVNVYNSSTEPGQARVTQHFILFEPDGQNMAITESFVFENNGKTTHNDPKRGTLRVLVPAAGMKSLEINATAPQGMPIRRAPEKTSEPDVYFIDFPIKPGESNIQLNYTIPFSSGAFSGRTFFVRGGPTSLIAPLGVTLTGAGLESKGQEPRSQASIFQTRASSYSVEITGSGKLRTPQSSESEGSGGPAVEQILPAVYSKQIGGLPSLYWVLGLGTVILTLGFILYARAGAAARPAEAPPPPSKKGKKR